MRWSSLTRRWNCPFYCHGKSAAPRKEDLQKKELALNQKEKELLKKEKVLQHKIKKYNQHNNSRAKADLRAANKLKRARKNLILALDSKGRIKKSKHKRKVTTRILKREKRKPKKKGNKGLISALTGYPLQCFTDLYNKSCYCNPGKIRRRRVGDVEPSVLRRICGGPCDCAITTERRNTEWNRKMLGMQMCRCETRGRNRYDAGDCYLMSLRRTPQVWIHHRWPRFYPHYLDARHQWKNFSYCLLFCAGILIWTPCILCVELCKCFFCTCCSD